MRALPVSVVPRTCPVAGRWLGLACPSRIVRYKLYRRRYLLQFRSILLRASTLLQRFER